MFDIGWTEMIVVAIVAILFVGPKELPGMLRTFGRAMRKVRALAGDFQKQFDDALKDAELDGVRDSINKVRDLDPTKQIKDKLNPLKNDLNEGLDEGKAESNDYDPEELFDESKAPDGPEPVTVDVDAALERQRKFDEAAAAAQSSGTASVPGMNAASKAKPDKPAAKTSKSKTPKTKARVIKATAKPDAKPATAARKKPAARKKAAPKAKAGKAEA